MHINYSEIGERIRGKRSQRGMTQEQLAEKADVGTTHISHIETGNTIPSLKTLIAIINALEVSADELLCDNLLKAQPVFHNDIAQEIADCSEEEIRVIADTVKALKTSLRKRSSNNPR